jgi:Occlusion-derived virus envelope protein ODV-E18.
MMMMIIITITIIIIIVYLLRWTMKQNEMSRKCGTNTRYTMKKWKEALWKA